MACGICRQDGHNKRTCPKKVIKMVQYGPVNDCFAKSKRREWLAEQQRKKRGIKPIIDKQKCVGDALKDLIRINEPAKQYRVVDGCVW